MKIKILRVVLCIVLAVSCFMLQSNFTRIIPILTAAPNLLLIVTFSVGFLKGRMWVRSFAGFIQRRCTGVLYAYLYLYWLFQWHFYKGAGA